MNLVLWLTKPHAFMAMLSIIIKWQYKRIDDVIRYQWGYKEEHDAWQTCNAFENKKKISLFAVLCFLLLHYMFPNAAVLIWWCKNICCIRLDKTSFSTCIIRRTIVLKCLTGQLNEKKLMATRYKPLFW